MENLTTKCGRLFSLALLVLLFAGCSQPKHQDSSIKYDSFDNSSRILITNFSVDSSPSNARQSAEGIKSYIRTNQYRASIYDITQGIQFLGTIKYLGDYQRSQWLEHPVQLGKRRLMLVSKDSFTADVNEPYYFGDAADIIEIDVKQSMPVYVTVSKQGNIEQPYFYQILINSEHTQYCEQLPEKHYSRREGAIKSYMKQQNIDSNNQDFYRFCKILSEQKLLISANKAGKKSSCVNCSEIQYTRKNALLKWNPDKNGERTIRLNN